MTFSQAIVCASFLGNVKLGQGPPSENGPTDIIIRDIYLLSLLRGRKHMDDEQNGISLDNYPSRERAQNLPLREVAKTSE